MRVLAGASLVLVAALLYTGIHHTAAPHCRLDGTGRFTAPDQDCTPGSTAENLTRAQACTHRPRVDVTELRKKIARAYGLTPGEWHGELDHRVPHFLAGADTTLNLWPEPGPIPNEKDRLENYVHARVCDHRNMSVLTAVRIFKGDWRVAYRRYSLDHP